MITMTQNDVRRRRRYDDDDDDRGVLMMTSLVDVDGETGQQMLYVPHRCRQLKQTTVLETRANAQCDGCPAEYRWRTLFNAGKCG